MKYRPISSELNASFAELSVFLSWWITLICSQKSIFELKRVEIWKLIKLRVKAVIVLQYAFTSVVVNQMHVFHKSTGTLANLNEVLPACLPDLLWKHSRVSWVCHSHDYQNILTLYVVLLQYMLFVVFMVTGNFIHCKSPKSIWHLNLSILASMTSFWSSVNFKSGFRKS